MAAIVPISSLADIEKKARRRALSYLEAPGANLSEEEAAKIAVDEVKGHRAAQRKKKTK